MAKTPNDDTAALVCFLNDHETELLRVIAAMIPPHLRRHLAARDVIQEVWLNAHLYKQTFQVLNEAQTMRFLRRAAQARISHFAAKMATTKRGGGRIVERSGVNPPDQRRSPSSTVARSEAVAAVMASLKGLSDRQRRMIQLYFFTNMSYEAIANLLEGDRSAASAVRSVIMRARRRMLAIMGPPENYF